MLGRVTAGLGLRLDGGRTVDADADHVKYSAKVDVCKVCYLAFI